MAIMKTLNGYEIYDDAAREQITGVTSTGTNAAYVATVKGVDALKVGSKFTLIPHVSSANTGATINVNNLGARPLKRRLSGRPDKVHPKILASVPVVLIYDGSEWLVSNEMADASDIYGIVPVTNGGTGGKTVAEARNNLGLGNTAGALPVANGGTGATSASAALTNLGITWGTGEAPLKGTPNTIYIQIN